jgi:phosphoribosyl-dephospho-CoA transferase
MASFARNQLVWLDVGGWQQISARDWDPQARDILGHWVAQDLPLVVCRQRDPTALGQLSLGLPAALPWERRRLALSVDPAQVLRCGEFPELSPLARSHGWGDAASQLAHKLRSIGLQARVYGSYGWQWLTGLPYLHAQSDIDLSLPVPDLDAAAQVVQFLELAQLPARIDGEIVFPGGQAVAWRELRRLLAGQTSQLMVKQLHSVALLDLQALRGLLAQAAPAAACV